MNSNRLTSIRPFAAEIEAGIRAIAAAENFGVEPMSRYRWERRGLLGRLVRKPLVEQTVLARYAQARAA